MVLKRFTGHEGTYMTFDKVICVPRSSTTVTEPYPSTVRGPAPVMTLSFLLCGRVEKLFKCDLLFVTWVVAAESSR